MSSKLRGKFILVIDDDVGILRALNKVLSSEGCVVAGASHPVAAMEYLNNKEQTFDLVITDLRMPIINGMGVLHAVKIAYPQVPVIVFSAFGGPEVQAEALRLGAVAFLGKPIDAPQLLSVVEGALVPVG